MEIGKLPMAIVGITIAVIICAVVLIPVVQESTQTHDTFTNDGLIYLDEYDVTSPDKVLVWTYESPNKITVDDNEITLPDVNYLSIDMGNDWFVRYTKNTSMSFLASGSSVTASVGDSQTITITLSAGTVSATVGETTKTDTYTSYLCITNNSDAKFVMKSATDSAYINDDSEFYAYGTTSSYSFKITGTVDDGATVEQLRGTTVVITDETVNSTTVDDHVNLSTIDSITFKYDGTNATYNIFVVPHIVTAEKSIHADQTTIQLINVIPILVIIGIVMLAVTTMIYYRR